MPAILRVNGITPIFDYDFDQVLLLEAVPLGAGKSLA